MRPKKVLQQLNITTVTESNIPENANVNINAKSSIKNIIHISDIHIRHGTMEYSRYDEYRHVFTNFVAEIACLDCVINRSALFVITGNIFHGKGKLDTPAIKLYFELMDRLLSFGSVIMICGNHEYRKDDLAHPDMLETMIIPYNKLYNQYNTENQNKLIYLKDTGYYVIDHIGFGVKSISNSTDLFPKPNNANADVDVNIALYHGVIDSVNSVWFSDYDYVMLGNNSYQFIDNTSHKFICGYPGTFIQQEYVDSYLHHGVLQWNINGKNNVPKIINIENDYSMIVLKNTQLNSIKIVYNVNGRKNIVDFDIAQCPKYARIKAIGFNTNNANELVKLFDEHNIKPVFITYANSLLNDDTNSIDLNSGIDDLNSVNNTEPITMTQLNCPNKWLEYISSVCDTTKYEFISKLMNKPDLLLLPSIDDVSDDIKERINNRNKKINDALSEYTGSSGSSGSSADANSKPSIVNNINFKVLTWNYIMCYGEANYFDFECMTGKFALLNGRNAMGKSAFLDVLCIALYGEPSKHRSIMYGKQNNGNIINNSCPSNKNMNVRLSFKVNDMDYEIYREYTYTKVESKQGLKYINATITNLTDNIVLCNTQSETNTWIQSMFGTIDDLLMSSFITQIETNNFFNLKQEEQKQVLDNALHLESISLYSKIIRESLLGYNDIINNVKSNIDIINNLKGKHDSNKIKQEIEFVETLIDSKIKIIKDYRDTHNLELGKAGNVEDFKAIIDFIKSNDTSSTNDTSANKRLTKLKRTLETNEFNSITEQDKLYCNQLILNGNDINLVKYEELKSQINELESIIQKLELDFGFDFNNTNSHSNSRTNIDTINNTLIILEKSKPERNLSDALFAKKQKQIDVWKTTQNMYENKSKWLENPDCLDMQREEKCIELQEVKDQYNYLIKHPLIKPQLNTIPSKPDFNKDDCNYDLENITIDLYNKLEENLKHKECSLTELYKNKVTILKTESEYTRWLKTYNEWTKKFSKFINDDCNDAEECEESSESIEELNTELQQTILYRDSIVKKLHEKEELQRELLNIDNELHNFENIPYNDTCWACKQQPMRIRATQINDTKALLLRNVSKINKYLDKIDTNDFASLINELNIKTEELHNQIDLQKEYEYSCEIKSSEYELWQEIKASWKKEKDWKLQVSKLEKEVEESKVYRDYVQYILWKTWRLDMKLLNIKISELTEDISNIDEFIKSYEQINEVITELDKETELRNKYTIWNESYIYNSNYKIYFETKNKIEELVDEIDKLDGSQKINSNLINKVKEYNKIIDECKLLEKYILYTQSNKTLDVINIEETQLNNLREKLILLKKEDSDNTKYNEKNEIYTKYYDTLINVRSYIIILDELFIGTANNNSENAGYKEWVYKHYVIPLIQSHINSFLGLIDNINLEIIYTNKTFQYIVHDRNNTPNLSMTSGYQRFIIGLALRIAFAKIGAVGQNIKHLFIDEGFVACDIYNLDKVNMILKAIYTYGGYDSIMLMSHLDTIRSAADICIDIKRICDNNSCEYSQIHFGDINKLLVTAKVTAKITANVTANVTVKVTANVTAKTAKVIETNETNEQTEPVKKTRKRITKV